MSSMALMREVASTRVNSRSSVLLLALADTADSSLTVAAGTDLESVDTKLLPVKDSSE
jgi:hypothetical protein